MNKTFFKMSKRSIKNSLSRFLSIVGIVAIGAGFLAGLLATTPDMRNTVNEYFTDKNLYDFYIQSTLGFSEEDVKALESESYVDRVMAIEQEDLMMKDGEDETLETRVFYVDLDDKDRLNQFELIDGRLPESEDECIIEVPNQYSYAPKLNSKFKNEEGDTFTAVGIAKSPMFMSASGETTQVGKGSIVLGMYFDKTKEPETYTAVYGLANIKDRNTFDAGYEKEIEKIKEKLEAFGAVQSKVRFDEIKKEAQDELDKNRAEFNSKKNEAMAELNKSKSQLENSQNQLNSGLAQLDQGIAQIDQAAAMMGGNLPPQMAAQKQQLLAQKAELEKNQTKIDEGYAEYDKGKAEVDKEFAKAEKKLEDAQKEIDEIEECEWFVNSRLDSNGIGNFKNDVDKVGAVAKVFPVFFFLVAALVVLTTMTRMIEEERMQVGTLKSLGYSNSSIRNYYLSYGLMASLIGSVVGLGIGFPLFPKIISNAYSMMYNLPKLKSPIIWDIGIVILVVNVVCILGAILFSVHKELKEKPATLMQPKAPAAGKRILLERITPLWKRLKFTQKVTLRNLFRYKKRFFMTIVGVAGCIALLIAGFGIRNSIGDIVEIQYGQINQFDITVSVDRDEWKGDKENFKAEGFFFEKPITVEANGESLDAVVDIPENDKTLKEFVDLRDRETKENVPLTDEGIVLSEKMMEVFNVEPGDKVTVKMEGEKDTEITVTGMCENYVQNKIYMTAGLYEKEYGKVPEFSMMFAKFSDDAKENKATDEIVEDTMSKDGVLYAFATDTIRDNFNDSVKNIDYIVMVLIFSAGALSIIVLYNLTNINICERKKELATIKVLGFFEKEVSSYIFREINLLAILGIVVGIPVGIVLHRFIIKTVEVGGIMFGRDIYLSSFVISAVIMLGFTAVVNIIMRKTIRKIDMVESMKAND